MIALAINKVSTSETVVSFNETTRCNQPEGSNLQKVKSAKNLHLQGRETHGCGGITVSIQDSGH